MQQGRWWGSVRVMGCVVHGFRERGSAQGFGAAEHILHHNTSLVSAAFLLAAACCA